METAEKYKWYSNKDTVIPEDGDTIIVAIWYDGWHFNVGYYWKEKNEINFYDDDSQISLNEVEKWMVIEDPPFKIS